MLAPVARHARRASRHTIATRARDRPDRRWQVPATDLVWCVGDREPLPGFDDILTWRTFNMINRGIVRLGLVLAAALVALAAATGTAAADASIPVCLTCPTPGFPVLFP